MENETTEEKIARLEAERDRLQYEAASTRLEALSTAELLAALRESEPAE